MWCKNEVVVIGLEHINTLGVIRALGRNGIRPLVVITGRDKDSFVKYSKYIKKIWFIEEREEEILYILQRIASKRKEKLKMPIIPTSDFAALILDENYGMLSSQYILPSIHSGGGMIKEYMDKMNQAKLAEQYHIKMAKTWEMDLDADMEPAGCITFPCIIKPQVSAYGKKEDIVICNTMWELKHALVVLKDKQYAQVIIQEYIDKDYEIDLMGCIHNGEIFVPGMVKKERIFPKNRGNMSFSLMQKLGENQLDFQKIYKLLKGIGYSGMFDIDLFAVGNQYYLNEINFRNSANSAFYIRDHIYIVYSWVCMVLDNSQMIQKRKLKKEYYVQNEFLELKQLKAKEISFFTWIKSFLASKSYVMLCWYDINPFFARVFNYMKKNLAKFLRNC